MSLQPEHIRSVPVARVSIWFEEALSGNKQLACERNAAKSIGRQWRSADQFVVQLAVNLKRGSTSVRLAIDESPATAPRR